MGRISGNGLMGGHSGRAGKHENVYTRVNRKTGKCYTVKLCNPNREYTAEQKAYWKSFGRTNAAIQAWIKEQRQSPSEAYKKLLSTFNRQTRYSTLLGMMVSKKMATIVDDQTVRITVEGETFDVKRS